MRVELALLVHSYSDFDVAELERVDQNCRDQQSQNEQREQIKEDLKQLKHTVGALTGGSSNNSKK